MAPEGNDGRLIRCPKPHRSSLFRTADARFTPLNDQSRWQPDARRWACRCFSSSVGLPRPIEKSPVFALAVATLALGAGSATLLFSVTRSVLWRPLEFPDSGRLTWVKEQNFKRPVQRVSPRRISSTGAIIPRSFESLAAFGWTSGHFLTANGVSERVHADAISAEFLKTLGVEPTLGRAFTRQEEQTGTDAVVILTDAFWRRISEVTRTSADESSNWMAGRQPWWAFCPPIFISNYSPIRTYFSA